jgi:hypothetical protein
MAIPIRNSAELQRLLVAIAKELVEANIFFRLHMDLIAASREFADEMNESWTFWDRTIASHLDAAILRLCKIYDQKPRNLGLFGLLDTVRANPHLFSAEEYTKRMEGRAPNLLIDGPPILDLPTLETDIAHVRRGTNAMVDRLVNVRHNYYSHRNADDVVADVTVGVKHPITRDEVGTLLRDGMEIANRYNALFDANFYSTQMVGHDDFKHVLAAVRQQIAALRRAFQEDCRRSGVDPPDF